MVYWHIFDAANYHESIKEITNMLKVISRQGFITNVHFV